MKSLCIADFDDTLILTDSLVYIMKNERWYMRPKLVFAGVRIVASRLLGNRMKRRSAFKKILLEYYNELPDVKRSAYITTLKQKINKTVITDIQQKNYDRIVIVSASEESIIREVIGDILPGYMIIANKLPDDPESEFETCYGQNKVKRLEEAVEDYADHEISVYTDSWSDKPLIDIAKHAYMISGENIEKVK
ncbi:MAG: haloacid dehalogenase-like hydrolase [Lachnospiraceae bacterium]|nr:haloacid dehalogenase-like hydrolase [Lachnospiraceae bacterium]